MAAACHGLGQTDSRRTSAASRVPYHVRQRWSVAAYAGIHAWADSVKKAAQAAAAPVDYVVPPLLAAASALIGNARWAQAIPGWQEPPHLWVGVAGDSGTSKSPGADCLLRDVLPVIERRMTAHFPDQLREWKAKIEAHKA